MPNPKSYSGFLCPICSRSFTFKANVFKHVKKFHSLRSLVFCKQCFKTFLNNESLKEHYLEEHREIGVICCSECPKVFTTSQGLKNHSWKEHGNVELQKKLDICCCLCNVHVKNVSSLQLHMEREHEDVGLKVEKHTFNCLSDFAKWKEATETESCAEFVKHRGDKTLNDGSIYSLLYCHRNGTYTEMENRKRKKSKTSNKFGGTCPARISVTKTIKNESEVINVLYQSVHVGHDLDVERLRRQKSKRRALENKMQSTVPKTLASKRIRLTSSKNLQKICRDFQLDDQVTFQKADAISVEIKVKKLQEEEKSVLIYKPFGKVLPGYPNISKNEFMLAIMNDAQMKMLELHSSKGLLVDSTHGMNKYGFHLTTLLVSDSDHEGFPVAVLYSTKVTSETFVPFFKSIQDRIPHFKPKIFISDDVPSFYDAFTTVFGCVEHKFLSSWHMRRTWNSHVEKIKCEKVQKTVIEDLDCLLEETDEKALQMLLETYINKWLGNSQSEEFAKYFQSNYANRTKEWATCTQLNYGVDINMKLKWWHSQLKYENGMCGIIERLDKSLVLVLSAISKKMISRIMSMEPDELTEYISAIHLRHNRSREMNPTDVLEIVRYTEWTVPSSHSDTSSPVLEVYNVRHERWCNCNIKCQDCNICIHQFSCTCYDYCVNYVICKHIHLICQHFAYVTELFEDSSSSDLIMNDDYEDDCIQNEETDAIIQQLERKVRKSNNLEQEKLKLIAKIGVMVSNCSTLDQLQLIRESLYTVFS